MTHLDVKVPSWRDTNEQNLKIWNYPSEQVQYTTVQSSKMKVSICPAGEHKLILDFLKLSIYFRGIKKYPGWWCWHCHIVDIVHIALLGHKKQHPQGLKELVKTWKQNIKTQQLQYYSTPVQ